MATKPLPRKPSTPPGSEPLPPLTTVANARWRMARRALTAVGSVRDGDVDVDVDEHEVEQQTPPPSIPKREILQSSTLYRMREARQGTVDGRQRLQTIPHPRAGFDRIVLSANLTGRFGLHLPSTVSEGYRRFRDRWTAVLVPGDQTKGIYRRIAQYRSHFGPDAPLIDVLYQPQLPFVPSFQLMFRASMTALLDLAVVERLAVDVMTSLNEPPGDFHISCVELTVDFPGNCRVADALHQQLYAPGARRVPRRDKRYRFWWTWCSRLSSLWVRLYWKKEDGLQVARIECIVRRPCLLDLHVTTIADLARVDWRSLFTRSVRLVEVVPPRTRGKQFDSKLIASASTIAGVHETVRKYRRKTREWLCRRLHPTPMHESAMQALEEMQLRLHATPLGINCTAPPPEAQQSAPPIGDSEEANVNEDVSPSTVEAHH